MALTPQEIAATQYFDEDAYVEAKAQMMYRNGKTGSVEDAKAQFLSKWTGDMIDHYLQYGAAENVNPSNNFDNSDYIQQVAVAEGLTYQEVKADLESQGMTPLAHFLDIGEDLGYTAPVVPEDEQVVVDPPVVEGETFTLTSGTDSGADFEGGDGDDIYDAPIVQNAFAGGVSNSLSSAADLDGGAGTDTLNAVLVSEFVGATTGYNIDVQPTTTSIEDINIEALDYSYNGVVVGGGAQNTVTLDAKNMTGIDEIGSYMSDGDLVIENLTTLDDAGNARNTEAITITMDHTDNFNSDNDASDLTVYFDEDYLLAGQSTTTSQANYWMLDEDSQDYTNEPLLNIERDGVTLTIDGVAVEIRMEATVAAAADSWTSFAAGLQDRIDEMVAEGNTVLEGITVEVDTANTDETYNDFGNLVTIPAISLIDSQGRVLIPTGFTSPEEATGAFDIYGRFDNEDANITNDPLTVNVELEKVGRDGEGGNLIIGGKDQNLNTDSDVDQADGIKVFNIAVNGDNDQPSNLGTVSSTNQALTTANISDGTDWDGAELTIRDLIGGGQELTLIDATEFSGDFSLAMSALTSQQALTSQFGLGNDSYDWMSVEADAVSSGKDYSISMGSGDDTVTATLDGDSVDAIGETFTLDAGAGDDNITLDRDDGFLNDGVSQTTMAMLDNIDINLGAGDDTLDMDNNFNANIDAGDGDDLVYMNANGAGGVFTIGQTTGAQNFGSRVLYHAELTITYAGFEQTVDIDTTSANGFVADQTTINQAVMEAIESDPVLTNLLTCTLNDGTQMLTIKTLYEGANSLGIAIYQPTLVNAVPAAGQVGLAAGDLSALETGFIQTTTLDSDDFIDAATAVAAINGLNWEGAVNEFGVGDNTIYTEIERDFEDTRGATTGDILDDAADNYVDYTTIGTDSATGFNLSTIEMGTGNNDIVVMHSNDNNAGVLKFDGAFGKVSVVNWHDTATATITNANQMGFNATDFTTLLDNQVDPSATANTNSAVDVAITSNIVAGYEAVTGVTVGVNNNNTALANSVNVIRFTEDVANNETFENLTAAKLVSALNNGGTAYGDINDNTLDAAIAAGGIVIGGTAKHIIMVENSTNEGEYKVFYVESNDNATTNANGNFTAASASELGVIDFGASVNLLQVGSVTHTSLITNLAVAIDNGDATFTYDANGDGTLAGGEGYTVIDPDVDPGNIPPEADDDTFTVTVSKAADLDVLDGDVDADPTDTVALDNTEAIVVNGGPVGATATAEYDMVNQDINFIADTAGTYTFEYAITDGNGGTDTATATVTVTDPSTQNQIDVLYGETGEVAATAASDVFNFDAVTALADLDGLTTQASITDFDTDTDSLQFDINTGVGATTLDQLNGVDGIIVQINEFQDYVLVNFGNDDNGGEVVTLNIMGVTDASLINVDAI